VNYEIEVTLKALQVSHLWLWSSRRTMVWSTTMVATIWRKYSSCCTCACLHCRSCV